MIFTALFIFNSNFRFANICNGPRLYNLLAIKLIQWMLLLYLFIFFVSVYDLSVFSLTCFPLLRKLSYDSLLGNIQKRGFVWELYSDILCILENFYYGYKCYILHQGSTPLGFFPSIRWVHRTGSQFDPKRTWILIWLKCR